MTVRVAGSGGICKKDCTKIKITLYNGSFLYVN
jgi:hypothetical protein